MSNRASRFDLEWWIISKRLIYFITTLIVLSVIIGGAGLYVWLYGNPFKSAEQTVQTPEGARFDSFEGDVRVTRASTRETFPARSDTRLYPGDIVQTQADARARVTLADGSTLLIKPNSVITIAENTRNQDDGHANVRVAVDRGFVNVRTEQQSEGSQNVVKTPLTENRLAAQTGASFGVRDDNSEEIRVGSGAVESTTKTGERAVLTSNVYTTVKPDGNFGPKEKLLEIPVPSSPRNLERVGVRRGGATSVTLRWEKPPMGQPAHYRVEIANSPFFVDTGKVVERDQLQSLSLSIGDLRQGNYFWRVRAVAPSGQASEWSEPQKFTVVSEGGGEAVPVSNVSVEYVGGQIHIIRGRTQPGTNIFCEGRQALAGSNGAFQIQIVAPPGAREVNLETEGTQGGRTSHKINLQ